MYLLVMVPASAIDARVGSSEDTLRRGKYERLEAILKQNGYPREEIRESLAELGEFEFVHMKGIWPLLGARLGVVQLVGSRNEENTVFCNHPARFSQQAAPVV